MPVSAVKAFQNFSKYYDLLYQDKDYPKECDFLEEIFRKYAGDMPEAILDAGCGTGGHSLILSERGYKVTGIDQSKEMINIAKKKASHIGARVDFRIMNMIDFEMGQRFDACTSMFASVGYVTVNEELHRCFSSIRKHLETNSLFIFDYWNGPAVLTIKPSVKVKIVKSEDERLIRIATPQLDAAHHLCKVSYHCIVTKGRKLVKEFMEEHSMRFLFPEEIRHYLEETSFDLLGIFPFMSLEGEADETVWNVIAIAKAREEKR